MDDPKPPLQPSPKPPKPGPHPPLPPRVPWFVEQQEAFVEQQEACFVVDDGNDQQLAYVYFENEPGQ